MQIIGATCNVLIRLWFRSLPLWANQNTTLCEGSLSIQLAHWSRVSQDRVSTNFLNTPDSTMVPIFGDAHPENFTISAYPGQPITTEIIDLDAAGFAPWLLDVRRALTAQRIFAGSMIGCETTCQDSVVLGWLEGFEQGLIDSDSILVQSKIVEDLIDEALEEGSESRNITHIQQTVGSILTMN